MLPTRPRTSPFLPHPSDMHFSSCLLLPLLLLLLPLLLILSGHPLQGQARPRYNTLCAHSLPVLRKLCPHSRP